MKCFGITDIGKKRNSNQDCFGIKEISESCYIIAVCDGMGGANGGEIASSKAIERFFEICEREINIEGSDEDIKSALYYAVDEANALVNSLSISSDELNGMGTTLVAAVIRDNGLDFDSIDYDVKTYNLGAEPTEPSGASTCVGAFVVNVGDSRAYLFSKGNLTQLTKDHSYVQYLIDIGELQPEKAAKHPKRNIITKAIGIEPSVLPDIQKALITESDKTYIMLVSDGLYSEIKESDIKKLLNSDKTVEDKAQSLVDLANKKGGRDNITVVLAEI